MAAIGGEFKRSFKPGRLLIPLIPGDQMDRRMPRCALMSGAPGREPETATSEQY